MFLLLLITIIIGITTHTAILLIRRFMWGLGAQERSLHGSSKQTLQSYEVDPSISGTHQRDQVAPIPEKEEFV